MSIYAELQPVVREILGSAEFKQGKTQLFRELPGNGPVDDPGRSVMTFIANLDGAVRGAKWSFVNTGAAVAGDLQITHSVVPGVEPQANDIVRVDDKPYRVKKVFPLPAAGTPTAYTLILQG